MTQHHLPRALRVLLILMLAALFAGCVQKDGAPANTAQTAQNQPLQVIPIPAHVERSAGSVMIKSGASILVKSDNAKAAKIAQQFASLVARTVHLKLNVQPYKKSSPLDGAIVLRLGDKVQAPDKKGGYRLAVKGDHILIAARNPAGLYYGTVTLWQLLGANDAATEQAAIPAVTIKDSPRFAWRGLMLDSARHFQSVADIKKLIDWMSLHKLDVLHWHLTDDQGWRLQIPGYPKLTKIGDCRKAVGPDAALTGSSDKPYCGFYTDDEVRDIVAYAAKHYVTIVPEIDIPGHMQAAIASYPWLGVTGKRPPVSTNWGINVWLLKPDQRTINFLHDVFGEVMKLFPSKYIHIGGDEAVKTQWKASPEVRAHMKKLGLKNMDALQGWFMTQIANYLGKHGRVAVGWDELLNSNDIPKSAVIMSWHGVSGAIKAAKKGHDAVLSPSPTLYLDHLQSSLHSEPPGRPQVESLKDIYTFDPVPAKLTSAQAKHILGLQANLWAEYMPTFARAQHAIFPRMAAWAEVAWSPADRTNWHSFLARIADQLARYRALGIQYADGAFAPSFDLEATQGNNTIKVTLSNQTGFGVIHYTKDGSKPTPQSPDYTAPLTLTPPVKLRAATYTKDGQLLAAPRMQAVTERALLTYNSDQFHPCTSSIVLRLEDDRPINGPRPVYKVNIADMCWKLKDVSLKNVSKIKTTVGNLPWNYKIPLALDMVVKRPQQDQYPALNIYLNYCAGRQLAHLSLKQATTTKLQTTLTAKLPKLGGKHTLCFIITGNPMQSFWGIDTIQLIKPMKM